MRKVVYVSLSLALTACGGGGGGSDPVSPTSNALSVNISASNTNPYQDDSVTLTWASNAKSCTASGDWSGNIDAVGTRTIQNANVGTTTYNINCTDGSKSTTSSVVVNTQEKPYFLEMTSAFPDPTNAYWFFDQSKPANTFAGNVVATNNLDMNGDGKQEFLMVVQKGQGLDKLRGQYVSEPCKSTTVIYELNGDKFVDVSDKYLDSNRDFNACVDQNSTIIDINGDGKPDIFFSANQEDGRNPQLGSKMDSQLVGWVSQPDGKYKIVKFGDSKWYHSIGSGIDDAGKPFVTGAGYPNNTIQNVRYRWSGKSLEPINDGMIPNISPVTFVFKSTDNKSSNLLVQQTWDVQMGAEGYVKENMTWRKTNKVFPNIKVVGEEILTLFSGDTRKIQVLDFNGMKIAGTGGGSNLDNLCSMKLYKGQNNVAVGTYALAIINNYAPGKGVKDSDIKGQNYIVSFSIENNTLVYRPLTIKGETNFSAGKFQCLDVNNDGYDDLVLGLGNDSAITSQRIYINQKDGTFAKLELGNKGLMTLNPNVNMYGSHMADFDNDGKIDVIAYPSNVIDNRPLSNSIKFYKGFKTVQ